MALGARSCGALFCLLAGASAIQVTDNRDPEMPWLRADWAKDIRMVVEPQLPLFIHHVKFRRSFQLLNKHAGPEMKDVPGGHATVDRARRRLFCWALVRPIEDGGPEAVQPELERMYSSGACDGWALFSNYDDPKHNIVKSLEGPSGKNVQSAIQFHSVYNKLVREMGSMDYDWYLELESDHFARLPFLKSILADGGDKPIYAKWKNAHLFNRAFLHRMHDHWPQVNTFRPNGCPTYAATDFGEGYCAGDISMPQIALKIGVDITEGVGNQSTHTLPGVGVFAEMKRDDMASLANPGQGWDTEEGQASILCRMMKVEKVEPLCRV